MMRQQMRRSIKIDALRGMAIVLMVLGHCLQYGMGADYRYWDNWIFKIIYSFHMPLFALISGYLIFLQLPKYNSFFSFVKRQLKSLYIPIIIWTFIAEVISMLIQNQSFDWSFLKNYVLATFDDIWFLWAVLYASVIIAAIKFFCKDNIVLMCIIWGVSLLFPNIYHIQLYVWTYPFFIMGYVCGKYSIKKNFFSRKELPSSLFLISLIVFIILLFFFNSHKTAYMSGTSIVFTENLWWKHLRIDIYRTIIGVVGCVVVVIPFMYMPNKHLNLLSWIGKASMGIYIQSFYLNSCLSELTKACSPSILLVCIETVTVLVICFISTWLISKVPILNMLLLGGRKIGKTTVVSIEKAKE